MLSNCTKCGESMKNNNNKETIDDMFCDKACAEASGYVLVKCCNEWKAPDDFITFKYGEEKLSFCDNDCAENEGYVQCENCEKYIFESDCLTTNDSKNFCDFDCANQEGYEKCQRCDEYFEDSEGEYVECDDYHYCSSDCRIEDGYEHCQGCSKFFDNNNGDGVWLNHELYCSEDCAGARKCENCDKYELENDGITTQEDSFYCSWECAERNDVNVCENCSEHYKTSNGVYVDNSYYCDAGCADADTCSGCGEYFRNGDLKLFEDERYCSTDCAEAVECSNCFEYVSEDDAIKYEQYHYCSNECAHVEGVYQCEMCEDFHDEEDIVKVEDGEEIKYYCKDCGYEKCESCGNGFSTREEFHGDNVGVEGRFCSGECVQENEDFVQCKHCNKWLKLNEDDVLEVVDGEDKLSFCGHICARHEGYVDCEICEKLISFSGQAYVLDDKIYCDKGCYNKAGYDNCVLCNEVLLKSKLGSTVKGDICKPCYSKVKFKDKGKEKGKIENGSILSPKELYKSSYTLENMDSKILLSNNLYRKKLDNDKKSLISKKHRFLTDSGYFENVSLSPYKQEDLGIFSFKYKVHESNSNFILINLGTIVLVRPDDNEVIEILDLTKVDSDKGLLNELITHGNHLELDLINVLNDDRRSPKVYLEKIKSKYVKNKK